MSMSGQYHEPEVSLFDEFRADGSCRAFGSLKIHGKEFQISVFVHRDAKDLLFLDQLRHAVDMAIKWARED